MSFFKSIFGKRSKTITTTFEPLSDNFAEQVEQSIKLLGQFNSGYDNEAAYELLTSNGISDKEAVEIIIFLPISFCRHFITELK